MGHKLNRNKNRARSTLSIPASSLTESEKTIDRAINVFKAYNGRK